MPTVLPPTELALCGVGATPNKGELREALRQLLNFNKNLLGDTGTALGALETLGVDYVPAHVVGLRGDGTTNNSPLLAAARTLAAGRTIKFGIGHFKFLSAISSGEDLCIEGAGDNTVLDFTGASGAYALDAVGTVVDLPLLANDVIKHDKAVVFASAPTLVPGDVFGLYSSTDDWSTFRPYYKKGEFCEVAYVIGPVAYLTTRLYDSYPAASVTTHKVQSKRFMLRDFTIKGTSITGLMKATFCINPEVSNVKGDLASNSVLVYDRCFKPVTNNPRFHNVGDGGDDYGLVIGNTQHSRVNGGSSYGRRHGVAHGGGAGVCCFTTRDSVVFDMRISNDKASGTHAADFHGNTEKSKYISCVIDGAASLQGKDNEYVDCDIYEALGGWVMYHAEVLGGRLGARGCRFYTSTNPQPTGRGIYDCGGNSTSITEKTIYDTTLFVTDCALNGENLTALTTFMIVTNRGCTKKINIEIDGVTADVNLLVGILRTSNASGTADSDFIIVDNIKGFPAGSLLHSAVGGAYLDFPHRLQKQSGSVELVATSGTASTIAAPINFKHPYPRDPHANVSTVGGINGNRFASAELFDLTGTAIRPMLATHDGVAWTATATRKVGWDVSMNEV